MSGPQSDMLAPKQFRRIVIDHVRSAEPISPACQHAPPLGMCGGCSFQDREYMAQVLAKREALRSLWAHDLPEDMLAAIDMIASPAALEYRTRMDYVTSKGRFGLRRSGKFNYIIELEQCRLIPDGAFQAARSVYERAMQLGLPDYNLRSHAGFLRYIVVRRSPQNTWLLALVTADPASAGVDEACIDELAAHALAQPGLAGFHWLINDTHTDLSFGKAYRHWGAQTLAMQVGPHTLQIGPNTFFQNNVALLQPLLDAVRSALSAPEAGMRRIADLYGGVGTIALALADCVGEIVTVESVEESALLARQNIVANGLENVHAVHADVLAFLREQEPHSFNQIIVDPPRTGLGPDVCAELVRLAAQRIVYVSCNVLSQLEDIRALGACYTMRSLHGYDMFPQTPHLEALAVLQRRDEG